MNVAIERASLGGHAHAVRATRAAGLGLRKREGGPHSERTRDRAQHASLSSVGTDNRTAWTRGRKSHSAARVGGAHRGP